MAEEKARELLADAFAAEGLNDQADWVRSNGNGNGCGYTCSLRAIQAGIKAGLEEAKGIMDERAAMYREKAERHDALADDSLNEHERFTSNAEASEWGAAAIQARIDQ